MEADETTTRIERPWECSRCGIRYFERGLVAEINYTCVCGCQTLNWRPEPWRPMPGSAEAELAASEAARAELDVQLAASAAELHEARGILARLVQLFENESSGFPFHEAFENGRLGHWDDAGVELDWPQVLERLRDPAGKGSAHSDPCGLDYELAELYRRARAAARGEDPGNLPSRWELAAENADLVGQVRYWESEAERWKSEAEDWEEQDSYRCDLLAAALGRASARARLWKRLAKRLSIESICLRGERDELCRRNTLLRELVEHVRDSLVQVCVGRGLDAELSGAVEVFDEVLEDRPERGDGEGG